MLAVNEVKPAIMDVIDVVAVLHSHVLFAFVAVHVVLTRHHRREFFSDRIDRAYRDNMLIDMAAVRVMEVPIVQVVDMPAMLERRMAAIGSVGVIGMPGMDHLMSVRGTGQYSDTGEGKEESFHFVLRQ
jgi:hypothetical protein